VARKLAQPCADAAADVNYRAAGEQGQDAGDDDSRRGSRPATLTFIEDRSVRQDCVQSASSDNCEFITHRDALHPQLAGLNLVLCCTFRFTVNVIMYESVRTFQVEVVSLLI
jgi:hypothetical protein